MQVENRSRGRRVGAAGAVLGLLLAPALQAAPPTPQDYEERRENVAAPDKASGTEKERGYTPEDYYLFLPRALLFVPNLALKVAFFPLRGLATVIDQYSLIERTEDLLYNDERTAGVLPTAGYQSQYGVNFGARAFHKDLFGNDESLTVQALFGGYYQSAYKFSFEGQNIDHTPLWIQLEARWEEKPGILFFGYGNELGGTDDTNLGPREASVRTRYQEEHSVLSATVGETTRYGGNTAHAGFNFLYHSRTFGPEGRSFSDPSIEQVYNLESLHGFNEGVDVLEVGPVFDWDTRDSKVFPTEGSYFAAFGSHTVPVSDDVDFWHYGLTYSKSFGLFAKHRVLSFSSKLEAVHGDDEKVPFSELVRLGGAKHLRGYIRDRFRDKVSFLASAEYRYPIHEMIAGEVFLDTGRVGSSYSDVFGGLRESSGLENLHYGGGMGFVFHSSDSILFKVEAAYGNGLNVFFSTDPVAAFSKRHKRL